MKRSWRYLLLFSIFVLLIGLTIFDFSLVENFLIDPLTRILWLVIRTVQSIDQKVFWILLILVVFVFTLWIIPLRREEYKTATKYIKRPQQEDRVEYWKSLYTKAADDAAAREILQLELKDLQHSIEPMAHGAIEKDITLSISKATFWQQLRIKLEHLFLNRILPQEKRFSNQSLDESINQILCDIETTLEIQNDRSKNKNNNN